MNPDLAGTLNRLTGSRKFALFGLCLKKEAAYFDYFFSFTKKAKIPESLFIYTVDTEAEGGNQDCQIK